MLKNHFKKYSKVLFLFLMLFASCSDKESSKKSAQMTSAGWVLENIDPTWWSSAQNHSAYFNIEVTFEDESLTVSDFESITFYSPDDKSWSFEGDDLAAYFDEDSSRFGLWERCWSSQWSDGDSILLGDYTVVAILTNGEESSKNLYIPAPGKTSAGTSNTAYTEDYIGSISTNLTPLPQRAGSVSASYDGIDFSVNFSINDSMIYNGYFWFYNATGDFIGGSSATYFRDYGDGTIDGNVNGGSALYVDGTDNVVTYTAADDILNSGYSLEDISSVSVVLTDGAQYANQEYSYDCRSISSMTTVTSTAFGVYAGNKLPVQIPFIDERTHPNSN